MNHYNIYRSPIRILEELGFNTKEINSELLAKEQSKFIERLHRSGEERFLVGSLELSSDEFTQFIKALDSVESLRIHALIAEHPQILELLEKHVISGNKQEAYRLRPDLKDDHEKIGQLISPYLAESIDHLWVYTIPASNYSQLNNIAPLFHFLSKSDGVFAFRKLNQWVDSLDERLNDPTLLRFEYPAEKYVHFHYSPFYEIINTAAKFYPQLPDTVADALTLFILSYKGSKNREDNLLKISNNLQKLHCSPQVEQTIERNHAQFRSETKESGKSGNFGLWMTISSVVFLLIVLLVFVLVRNSGAPETPNTEEEYRDYVREEYINRDPSPSRVWESGFDEDAFKLFHEHTYASVVQQEFTDNEFVWDGVPGIKSPLEVIDSASMKPKGKKVYLTNKTTSEMLMVIRDDNALSTYYVGAKSKKSIHVDPNSLIFFYSGNNWNVDKNIVYDHPYQNIMTSAWTVRYTGHFRNSKKINTEFLKDIYLLKKGSIFNLYITEEDGKYVFKDRKREIPTI